MLKYQLVQDTYFSMTAEVNTDKEFIYFPLKLSAPKCWDGDNDKYWR